MPTIYTPPVSTYVALATTTLSGAVSNVSFSNLPTNTYKDLFVVADFQASTGGIFGMRFNNDSATSYSRRYMIGDGTTATGGGDSSFNYFRLKATGTFRTMIKADILDYRQTDRNKVLMFRGDAGYNGGGGEVIFTAGGWPVTNAVTSIQCFLTAGTFNVGSVFSLYGIES